MRAPAIQKNLYTAERQAFTRTPVRHEALMQGGELHFGLTTKADATCGQRSWYSTTTARNRFDAYLP